MVVQVQTQTVYNIMARTGQCALERYRIMSAGRHESEYKVYEARHTQWWCRYKHKQYII